MCHSLPTPFFLLKIFIDSEGFYTGKSTEWSLVWVVLCVELSTIQLQDMPHANDLLVTFRNLPLSCHYCMIHRPHLRRAILAPLNGPSSKVCSWQFSPLMLNSIQAISETAYDDKIRSLDVYLVHKMLNSEIKLYSGISKFFLCSVDASYFTIRPTVTFLRDLKLKST